MAVKARPALAKMRAAPAQALAAAKAEKAAREAAEVEKMKSFDAVPHDYLVRFQASLDNLDTPLYA